MNEIEKIKFDAEEAIKFWTEKYDGCYPPQWHHPVYDMQKVKLGWKTLLSELEKEKERAGRAELKVTELDERIVSLILLIDEIRGVKP
jgi:hypothetical protein